MRMVKSRNPCDCGMTSLSMIAKIPYKEALKILHPRFKKGKKYKNYGVNVYALERALKKLKIPFKERKRVKSWSEINTSLLIIKTDKPGRYHALAWDAKSQSFYDALCGEPVNDDHLILVPWSKKLSKPGDFYRKSLLYCYELIP